MLAVRDSYLPTLDTNAILAGLVSVLQAWYNKITFKSAR